MGKRKEEKLEKVCSGEGHGRLVFWESQVKKGGNKKVTVQKSRQRREELEADWWER